MTGSPGPTMADHDPLDLLEVAARTAFSHEQSDRRQAALLADNWNQRLSDEDRAEYRALASAILANVEPLIRADEQDRWLQSDHLDRALRLARADERERIAAAIETTPEEDWEGGWRDVVAVAARIARNGGE